MGQVFLILCTANLFGLAGLPVTVLSSAELLHPSLDCIEPIKEKAARDRFPFEVVAYAW